MHTHLTKLLYHSQQLIKQATVSPAVRQSAIMTVGNVATGVITAITMILASRIMDPESFGIFSVSIAIMGVMSRGGELGLNQLMPRLLNYWHDDAETTRTFLSTVLSLKILFTAITIILGILASSLISELLNYPYPTLIYWALVGCVSIGLYEHVSLVLSARHEFAWVSALGIIQALMKALGFTYFLFFFSTPLNAITGVYYLAPLLACFIVLYWFPDLARVRLQRPPTTITKNINKYAIHALVAGITMTLISNVDLLMVQRYLSSFESGIYSGASRIAIFIGFITAAIGGVLNNRVSRYKDPQVLKMYLKKSSVVVALALLGFLFFIPFSELVLVYSIGPEYLSGMPTLTLLVLNAFLGLAIAPYISYFYAVEHPAYFSVGGILQVVVIIGGSWLLIPQFGLIGVAFTRIFATLIFAVYTLSYIVHSLRLKQ